MYAVRQTRVTRDVAKLELKLAPEESIEPCVGDRPGPRTLILASDALEHGPRPSSTRTA